MIDVQTARSKLFNYISTQIDVDSQLLRKFVDYFELEHHSKKDIIISEKANIDKVSFIISGLVRIYYVKEEKEITTWLLPENNFFMPVYHIFTKNNNSNTYEALEDTITLHTTYSKMEEVYTTDIQLERMGRLLVQRYYSHFLHHSYNVLFLSAEERYKLFVEGNPELLNRVPLKYIASYLGIKQETLSRIRSIR